MRTTFQFSMLPRDAAVVPHSDAPRKLVSLLLYFRDRDWQDAWGGGTEFYAPLDPERARGWGATDRIPFEEFKPIGSTPFVGQSPGRVRALRQFLSWRSPARLPARADAQGAADQHQARQVVERRASEARVAERGVVRASLHAEDVLGELADADPVEAAERSRSRATRARIPSSVTPG